jgi:hypothetical protein
MSRCSKSRNNISKYYNIYIHLNSHIVQKNNKILKDSPFYQVMYFEHIYEWIVLGLCSFCGLRKETFSPLLPDVTKIGTELFLVLRSQVFANYSL